MEEIQRFLKNFCYNPRMDLMKFVFIGTVTIITFAISLLTAKIYTTGLNTSANLNKIIFGLAILMPILFISTMIVGRSTGYKLPFAELYSYVTTSLSGIGFYLFLSSIFLGLIILALSLFGINSLVMIRNLSFLFLVIGIVMGISALVQAKFIKLTNYEVILKDAPVSWNGKTAILVSDTHFGLINHKNFSDKVVNKILEINPDFVLHAGDFYDGPDNESTLITESWAKLTAQIPVFYAPGNHEEYGPYDKFINSVKDAKVTTLQDSSTVYDGVQIAGITYRNKNQHEIVDKVLEMMKLRTDMPTILINHPPTFQKEAQNVSVDMMVSGHTHKGQFWPINFLVRAIYGKYFYGMNIDESLTTITTSGVGTAGPAMRLFNTPELVLITFKTN